MQMQTNMGHHAVHSTANNNQSGISPEKNFKQLQQQNAFQSSSGGNQSQNSSGNQNVQFNPIRLQSEVLELIQTLSLDLDQMSPVEVRQHLRSLITAEQEARQRRDTYLNEIMQHRANEIESTYKLQFEKLRASFELETFQFEKTLKDRAQGIIKGIQINQLDRLINLVGRVRQIHSLHGGTNSSQSLEADLEKEPCMSTQQDLHGLIQHIDGLMAVLSSDDAKSFALLDQSNLSSQEATTPFNPNLRDQVLSMQQKSSNGVVAINNRQNQAVVAAHHIGLQTVPAGVRFGTATSYGGVTSGDNLPMNASNILSPNTTPSQEFPCPQVEATLSNPQIQNMQRSNTQGNQFVKPGANGRPRFVYDLPKDFPFNEACIEKSFSNDLANAALQGGSHGNGSHSQNTTSNHDVNPEDVLRTFTNSLHSGGTLGAIHDSLTYYKEALASKEFSNNNMSPSNAYQNFMWKKNLVGEIQKLAKEISRIPTEEAKILADLSKSHISQDGGSRLHGVRSGQNMGMPTQGNQWPQQPPPGMTTAEAISKGLGFIGNNESSILMDLNRASIVAARKEAEDLKQKAKRIVDDSATRLEPVVKSFTDAPLNQHMMKAQNLHGSNANSQQSYQQQHFIQYQQQPSGSIQDSQGTLPEGQHSSSQNMKTMYEQQRAANDSALRDSCVMYGDVQNVGQRQQPTQSESVQQSPQQVHPHLNYHASNERSQLSESGDAIIDETQEQYQTNQNPQHQPRGGQLAQAVQNKIASSHRRHGSVVVGEHTIGNRIETMGVPSGQQKRDIMGREINVYAERRSIQHGRDELSPKQLRNESLSVQRSSIAAKRKVNHVGFFSNDAAATFTDMDLDQIEQAQQFQQTTSFAPQNKTPWWLEDANDLTQNQVLFQQTAGPNMQARNVLASKLKSTRRRGTQSVRSHHPSISQQNNVKQIPNSTVTGVNDHEQIIARFGDQNLEHSALDNKGRIISRGANMEQTSGNLYDELSRVAEHQSSRSVLDGISSKARNQHGNLNRTMQVKKQKNQIQKNTSRLQETPQSGPTYNREVISKSVVTNGDRASPSISASGATNGSRVAKMKIKNAQIKLVNNTVANKRNSIQMVGAMTGQQNQSKSVSREGRLKIKLVTRGGVNTTSQTPGIGEDQNEIQMSNQVVHSSNQSPRSRNERKLVMATGQAKSTQNNKNLAGGTLENQRQREFSPQHANNSNINNLQSSNQASAYTNKIPFKSSNKDNSSKRDEANSASGHRVRNNFFVENNGDQLQEQSMDSSSQKRQINNMSHLSAPISSSNQQQPLKIRRNRKQAKPAISPNDDECDDDQEQPEMLQEREEAEQHFSDIARNLRDVSQQQSNNIFIRKGSQQVAAQGAYQSGNTNNQSVTASLYGAGSVQQSRDDNKSRQPFVRTYKTQKSRQAEDLDRPFGTERVAFHKSALMSNNQGNQKSNMTQEEAEHQMQVGYRRPAGSVVTNPNNAVTMRVQSNSQPPFAAGQVPDHMQQNLDDPQIIPPPTEIIDDMNGDQHSTPGQLSGGGSIHVNAKRPVVKMTAINFIAPDNQAHDQQSKYNAQVSNFASQPNSSTNGGSAQGQFSFHHPQQPSQGKFPSHAKKPSFSAQIEASPYMTQHKVVQGTSQAAANKRIIHLKRPSTNFQIGATNQPSLLGKNAFAQRAASRVEQSDRQNELAFQNNTNNGATSGGSVMSAIQRPTTQIRISKKTGMSHKTNNVI